MFSVLAFVIKRNWNSTCAYLKEKVLTDWSIYRYKFSDSKSWILSTVPMIPNLPVQKVQSACQKFSVDGRIYINTLHAFVHYF